MDDYMSRQVLDLWNRYKPTIAVDAIEYDRELRRLLGTNVPDTNVGDINKFIDSLEEIFADLRERHVDNSVCGLCEYDGAYIGQSGDWCNECPGFDRDDCFKLSDKCRKRWIDTITKALPSTQPEIIYCKDCVKHNKGLGNYEVHPDGSTTWIWKDSACPLVSWRDKAQGHEFDYQFCAYAEKREVTT